MVFRIKKSLYDNEMNIFLNRLIKFFFTFILILQLTSWETIDVISGKISEYTENSYEYVSSIFSSEGENEESEEILLSEEKVAEADESKKEEISENNDTGPQEEIVNQESNFEEENVSEEVLESVEVENVEVNNISEDKNIKSEFSSPLKDETNIEEIENKIDDELEFKLVKKLKLKNKIQFKIATINFNSGSSSLNRDGYKKIMKVLKLANERDAIVKIVGHASTRTKDMDILKHKMVNFVISDKRAQAVASVFVKNKFPLDKLITEAVSDSKPLFHEVMPAGTNANQRTEIYLIYWYNGRFKDCYCWCRYCR